MIHVTLGSVDFDDRIPNYDACIYWQDDLNFGPVPATETLDALSRIRETFWLKAFPLLDLSTWNHEVSSDGDGHEKDVPFKALSFAERDDQISRLDGTSEVVIWCGPNRREVLMLAAV